MTESATNQSGKAVPAALGRLDFCKGLAIAWIVLVHALRGWFGWQGVHIFIVLGGFTLTYATLNRAKPLSWGQWYVRRAERILPSYWLTAIAGFLVVVLVATLNATGTNRLNVSVQAWKLFADLTLLRNFSYRTMLADPNSALWFVSLIVSFYLVFPFLYSRVAKGSSVRGWFKILMVAAAIEFVYRAVAIFWLDGMPVGYGHGFLRLMNSPAEPLNAIAETFAFQLWAPFGFAPSRLGEFVLGMIGAFAMQRDQAEFDHSLFSPWSLPAGLALWLCGSALLYCGRWGWVFADFMIAAGLVLWVINAARLVQSATPRLFRGVSRLGVWSYSIFLTHLVVGYAHANLYTLWMHSTPLVVLMLFLAVALIVAASWLLLRLDRSLTPKHSERA